MFNVFISVAINNLIISQPFCPIKSFNRVVYLYLFRSHSRVMAKCVRSMDFFPIIFAPHFSFKNEFPFVYVVHSSKEKKKRTHFLTGNNKIYEFFFSKRRTRISVTVYCVMSLGLVPNRAENPVLCYCCCCLVWEKIGWHFIGVCCLCVIISLPNVDVSSEWRISNCKKRSFPSDSYVPF